VNVIDPGLPSLAGWLLFAGAVFVLNATPGVDMLLTITRTLGGGVRAGLAAGLGISLGCLVHTLAAAFGLAALLAVSTTAFSVIKWAGAAYLSWLGVGLLRQAWRGVAPSSVPAATSGVGGDPRSLAADFRAGLMTNLLNPKVALFVLAFLPQFIARDAAQPTLAFLLLGAWMVLQGTLFLAGLVLIVAPARRVAVRPAVARWLQALAGGLFLALAARIVAEPFPPGLPRPRF
jgi:threonine/homoserine/homoserine lactone efflux protein